AAAGVKAGAARTTSKPIRLRMAAAASPVRPAPTMAISASVLPSWPALIAASFVGCRTSGAYTHKRRKSVSHKVVDERIAVPEMSHNSGFDSLLVVAFTPRARWKAWIFAHCLFTAH